ncbi:unnamed protein product [Aphanomyces euteiches]
MAGRKQKQLGPENDAGWTYQEALSPNAASGVEEDIFYKSGITHEMILQSQRNQESMQHIYSTVFTKENIQKLGFRNLIKQIRSKLGKTTQVPTCEIRMTNVNYCAVVAHHDSQIQTLASTFRLPSLGSKKEETKFILKNINAIFKPGTMTLVLGPPGCGKTTLLKHLAGILHVKGKEKLAGSITYNGCKPNQVDLSSLAAYVQQTDNHFPTLTVKETFEFSHKCLVGKIDPNDPLAVNEQHMVDILISVFGLTECADTITGDEMTRGVSGGQKRRVTVGEMMTGRATTLLLDEFSNGLDASTTYDIAKAVKTMVDVLEKTVVMTMLQPPPEVYDLFDNILVLDKGQVVYNGPRTHLPAYFRTIGYECPPRKDIADFLQEVTTPLGVRFANDSQLIKDTKRPTTPADFAARFRESSVFRTLMREVAAPEKHSWNFANAKGSKVALGYFDCLKVVFGRAAKASLRDRRFNRSRLVQAIVLGTIVGTVFLDAGRNKVVTKEIEYVPIKVGLLFLAILFQGLSSLSSIEAIISRRAVLYKQSAFHFFHISTYALAEAVMDLLWTVPQVFLFSAPVYYAVGLANTAGSFLIFVGTMYLSAITYSQLFKFVSALSPDAVLAKVFSMLCVFLHIVFSGYILPESKTPSGWIWIFWSNPMAWMLRMLVQNEFLSTANEVYTFVPSVKIDNKIVTQPLQDGRVGNWTLGQRALDVYGISLDDSYILGGFIFMIGAYVLLVALTTMAYTYVRIRSRFSAISEGGLPVDSVGVNVKGSGINALPFTPVTLSFRDLFYTIPVGKGKDKTTRQLLKGIHGFFEPGTLTALMGSTGAGKTTLMDVIAGRKTACVIDGDMFVNGHLLDRKTFNGVSGYCEQTDVHEETATVRESFMFSASLRLPGNTTDAHRSSFVDDILDVLELTPKAHAQYSTLTQGERKRVTIGVELLSNPSILFLDEPTTGLDSRAATIVMECVKRISESGRTVVCTIHQPSTVLFELFDKLLLLKTGGELVYFGDLGSKSVHLLEYFAHFDGLDAMKPTENPATYMLNCIGAGTGGAKIDVDFAQAYKESQLGQRNEAAVLRMSEPTGVKLSKEATFNVSFASQFALLFGRQWTTYWRSPSYNVSRAFVMVFMPLIFGSCFYGMKVTTSMDTVSQMALMFMALSTISVTTMSTTLPFVYRSRGLYYREKLSEMYAPAAHAFSLALVELLYTIVLSAIYFNVFYWLCGLNSDTEACLVFWIALASNLVLFAYMGHLLVYGTSSMAIAVLLNAGLASVLFLFSGFMISGNMLSKGWRWLYWISPLHYTLESIIMSQYKSQTGKVLDSTLGTQVFIKDYVQGFFNDSFSYDQIGRALGLLWAIIAFVLLVNWRLMAKVNHMNR